MPPPFISILAQHSDDTALVEGQFVCIVSSVGVQSKDTPYAFYVPHEEGGREEGGGRRGRIGRGERGGGGRRRGDELGEGRSEREEVRRGRREQKRGR